MNRKFRNVIAVFLIAVVWGILSTRVTLMLAEAEDPPNPAVAPNPWLLRATYAVVTFPVTTFQPWKWMEDHLGEPRAVWFARLGMYVNGLLWGCLLVFTFRHILSFIRNTRGKINDV